MNRKDTSLWTIKVRDLECEVERLKKLALEAYETPMNTGKEKCRIIELLSEMIA